MIPPGPEPSLPRTTGEPPADTNTASATRQLSALLHSLWILPTVTTAFELGLFDLLASGLNSAEALAAPTKAHTPSLHRLLRALAALGLCDDHGDGSFTLTPVGSLLETHAHSSMRALSTWIIQHQMPAWAHLLTSVRTGKTSLGNGTANFGLESFHLALVDATRQVASAAVRAYDFSRFRRLVDVGGGYGELLAAVLQTCPDATGVLFDLPAVMDGARHHLQTFGLAHRCEFIAGDFFTSVPPDGDAYLLKTVIHDWDDAGAIAILRCCRAAMPRHAKLLILEHVMPDRIERSVVHQDVVRRDLNMLVMMGGRERTESEYQTLLRAAQLAPTTTTPANVPNFNFSIMEAIPC